MPILPLPRGRKRLRPLAGLDLAGRDHRLGAALDAELLQDGGDVRLHGRLRDAELVGDLLVEEPSDSIISTRTCCGVSVASRAIRSRGLGVGAGA